jgi:hypothetical protein
LEVVTVSDNRLYFGGPDERLHLSGERMSALSNLPALTRGYFTRANQPFGANNTTALLMDSFWFFSLVTNLTDINTAGTTSGSHARHANSVWFPRGSSKGSAFSAITSPGVVGTDLIGNAGVFDPTLFVRATMGTDHSWILMENTNINTECMVNFSGTAANISVHYGPTGLFTGGSRTQCPQPSDITKSLGLSQTAYENSQGGQFALFYDYTLTGNTHWFHFTCADSGEFWVGGTRSGLGWFHNFMALWQCANGEATDTVYNRFVLTNTSEAASTPGAMAVGRLNSAAACASIQVAGVQKSSGGLVLPIAGGTAVPGVNVEAQTAKYISNGLSVVELTPNINYRGVLPDLHATGSSPPGTSIPLTSQVRTQTGHLIVPFTDTAPNM